MHAKKRPSVASESSFRPALTAGWSRRKLISFAVLLVVGISALAVVASEYLLRVLDDRIARSERMQPGLIRYDPRLGWALAAGWSGRHQHHDFDVAYAITPQGLRDDPAANSAHPRVLVLGDSFTFGLGVAGAQTFVSRLNTDSERPGAYLNMGMPGYSTDQQYLLYRQRGAVDGVDTVLLVVYLANDLFDNALPYPLQADHGKPWFKLKAAGRLELQNTPVPMSAKPAAARAASLSALVLGGEGPPPTLLERSLGNSHLARRLGLFQPHARLPDAVMQRRFQPYLDLFMALTAELQALASRRGAELAVALLPGASYVEQPRSMSAQYQQFLLEKLQQRLSKTLGIQAIDLASPLRQAAERNAEALYFPYERHLNAAGHQRVAELLAARLGDRAAR